MNLNAVDHNLLNQRGRGRQIALLARNHVGERRFFAEPLDVIARRLITVVEQNLAIFRSRVERRHRGALHVVHRVLQSPPAAFPWTAVEDLRSQRLIVFGKFVDGIKARRRITVEPRFSEKRNAVAKDVRVIKKARIPVVEAYAMNRARHLVRI